MSQFFTLVFEGDITKFQGNPHLTDTPFGRPVASGIGNAFDAMENIEEINDAASKLVEAINRHHADQ